MCETYASVFYRFKGDSKRLYEGSRIVIMPWSASNMPEAAPRLDNSLADIPEVVLSYRLRSSAASGRAPVQLSKRSNEWNQVSSAKVCL